MVVKFFRADQIGDGLHYIGIEGEEVTELTDGEYSGGIIVSYSKLDDSEEITLILDEDFGSAEGKYLIRLKDGYLFSDESDTVLLERDSELIAEEEWKTTKKYSHGYVRTTLKNPTPRNLIKFAIPAILKAKKEGRL